MWTIDLTNRDFSGDNIEEWDLDHDLSFRKYTLLVKNFPKNIKNCQEKHWCINTIKCIVAKILAK